MSETNEAPKTMPLPVKLTEGEVALRAQELASAEAELGEVEVQLDQFTEAAKGTKKNLETKISEARAKVGRFARVVRDRSEYRLVEVIEEPDYERGAMDTVRKDTGEIVSTRGLTETERQQTLFTQRRERKGKVQSN
jgi:hypothetical protein